MKNIYKLLITDIQLSGWRDEEYEPDEIYFSTKNKMIQYVKNDLTDIHMDDKIYIDEQINKFRDGLYMVDNDDVIYEGSIHEVR
jgi:hypothetical protein